jgi:hypothetical protein
MASLTSRTRRLTRKQLGTIEEGYAVPFTIEPTPVKYTPDAELDALIRAGLGDVERSRITPEQHARAMRGEIVRPYEAAMEKRRHAAYRVNERGEGTSGRDGRPLKRS